MFQSIHSDSIRFWDTNQLGIDSKIRISRNQNSLLNHHVCFSLTIMYQKDSKDAGL